mmetsp:Transcript_42738/g.79682  ORF Transcript_42738/g.79682 Transcript_42738/m.79682 type:complete len:231 (-) Transcript_42738:7-699(-)
MWNRNRHWNRCYWRHPSHKGRLQFEVSCWAGVWLIYLGRSSHLKRRRLGLPGQVITCDASKANGQDCQQDQDPLSNAKRIIGFALGLPVTITLLARDDHGAVICTLLFRFRGREGHTRCVNDSGHNALIVRSIEGIDLFTLIWHNFVATFSTTSVSLPAEVIAIAGLLSTSLPTVLELVSQAAAGDKLAILFAECSLDCLCTRDLGLSHALVAILVENICGHLSGHLLSI